MVRGSPGADVVTTAGELHSVWRTLPVGRLDDIIGTGTCLILAPHPDDESLGCGGLIAQCVQSNRLPLVVVLTDGAGSHPGSHAFPAERLRAVRADEVRTAVGCLGLPPERVIFLGEPDTRAPHCGPGFDRIVARLATLLEPDCTAILAPWRHDPHGDHKAASLAAEAAAGCQQMVRHVAYPVWGWTLPADSPVPATRISGWRLDIRNVRNAKWDAIQSHKSQYGGLITDDPTGFQLPAHLLSVFDSNYETYLLP